jgi:hypothetical protein
LRFGYNRFHFYRLDNRRWFFGFILNFRVFGYDDRLGLRCRDASITANHKQDKG